MSRHLGEKSMKLLGKLFETGAMAFYEFQVAGKELDTRLYRRSMYNNMYSLQRAGYVEVKKGKKNKSFFHLTPRGRLSFLKYLHLEKLKSKKWDGHWRVAIFDIPENRKKLRDRLRIRLKELQFYQLQESVYITPYPVTKDLDNALGELKLKDCFRYLTVTEIDGEEELKEYFDLVKR